MILSFRSRRRLVRIRGTAGRTWRHAERARRRAIVVVGRPVLAARGMWHVFVDWFNGLGLSENAILLGFAVVVGTGAALGVVGFYKLIDAAYGVFYRWPGTFLSRSDFLAYRPLLTAAGFAAAWAIMRRFGQGHDGLNVPDVQLAVARRGGRIPVQPALARTAASAVTIGSGGSAGSEGPVAVLGSMLGSWLGGIFRFESSRVSTLVGAGAAAAISAAFNAPLAGAFFALEEILGSFAAGAFSAVVVSSVVAAVVSRAVFGNHPAFPIPVEYGYTLAREVVLFYPLLGALTGLVSALFIWCYFRSEEWAKRLPVPKAALPWIGGLLVGGMVYLSRGILVGYGHLAVHVEVFGQIAWYFLLLLALGKIVATSITLTTGGSGGLFTPALYIGAATGGAFGVLLRDLFPAMHIRPEAYALVGMGALVAGATNAPITGILIVFEMTNDYAIVLPLMLTTVICHHIARRLEPDSLYSGWQRRRGERIEHGADRRLLTGLCVRDAYERAPQVFRADAPVATLLQHLRPGEQMTFPVVDDRRRLLGVVTMTELGQLARDRPQFAAEQAAVDVAGPTETVALSDSLLEATRRLGVRGATAVPVVEEGSLRLIGLISRSHILAAYERALSGHG
ncbi:MAG: chloride channel protein [Gemmatimonadales bacterium]